MNRFIKLLVSALAWLVTPFLHAEYKAFTLQDNMRGEALGQYMDFLVDVEGRLSFKEVLQKSDAFVAGSRDFPTFGFGHAKAIWGRLKINNPSDVEQEIYVAQNHAFCDKLTLYIENTDGSWSNGSQGDLVPFSDRPVGHRYPVFPIKVPPGEHQYLFELNTVSSAAFIFQIWTPQFFHATSAAENIYAGCLFAVCFAMLVSNLFIYMKFPNRSYLFYVLYSTCYAFYLANYFGFFQQFVMPEVQSPYLLSQGLWCVIELTVICAMAFTLNFLELSKQWPSAARVLKGFMLWEGLCFVNALVGGPYYGTLVIINSLVACIGMLFIGIVLSRRMTHARYYSFAWSWVLTGNIVFILAGMGVFKASWLIIWVQQTGGAIEMLILSFALGERMAQIAREREISEHKLRLELETRVMLASDLAHRTNNPLNYIQTGLGAVEQEIKSLNRGFNGLLSEVEADEASNAVRAQFDAHFQATDQSILQMRKGIERSVHAIEEIRALSVVRDGEGVSHVLLSEIFKKAQGRLMENIGKQAIERFSFHEQIPGDLRIYTNSHALEITLEALLRVCAQEAEEHLVIELLSDSHGSGSDVCFGLIIRHSSSKLYEALEKEADRYNHLLKTSRTSFYTERVDDHLGIRFCTNSWSEVAA